MSGLHIRGLKWNLIALPTTLKTAIRAAARELFDIDVEQLAAEVPPRSELGDLAFPVAFELAKQLKQKTGEKRAPRVIAEALKSKLEAVNDVSQIEVAGAGYLNVFFNRAQLLSKLSTPSTESANAGQ